MPPSNASAPVTTALVCAAALGTAAWAGHRALASSSLLLRKKSTQDAAKVVVGDALPPGAFDVVVVGAGPAGSTAAYYLANGGARVVLLEKEKFPRYTRLRGREKLSLPLRESRCRIRHRLSPLTL